MASSDLQTEQQGRQHVIVLRHGDCTTDMDPLCISMGRLWDPPLVEAGLVRAFRTGLTLRDKLGFPIHRVFVSPFLRCVQTAAAVVFVVCAMDNDDLTATTWEAMTSETLSVDASRIKVSIEYGLAKQKKKFEYGSCEMLNQKAIECTHGEWGFDISELEALLPTGTVDHTVERVFEQMLPWEETESVAEARYKQIIVTLADKYPSENLVLVTHGKGVLASLSAFWKDARMYQEEYRAEYCAYSNLERPIFLKDESFTVGNFYLLTNPLQTGICPRAESLVTYD